MRGSIEVAWSNALAVALKTPSIMWWESFPAINSICILIPAFMQKAFMNSMRMDLYKSKYLTEEEYKNYIYGSADVVGLMCLKVFVKGNEEKYNELKDTAMSLGSAF